MAADLGTTLEWRTGWMKAFLSPIWGALRLVVWCCLILLAAVAAALFVAWVLDLVNPQGANVQLLWSWLASSLQLFGDPLIQRAMQLLLACYIVANIFFYVFYLTAGMHPISAAAVAWLIWMVSFVLLLFRQYGWFAGQWNGPLGGWLKLSIVFIAAVALYLLYRAFRPR